nr:GGDEF domain-containing protein [uncultured Sphaerochaeta sp.]
MNPLIIVDIFSMVPLFFTIHLATRHLSGSRQNRYYILASYITLALLAVEVLGYSMAGRTAAYAIVIHLLSNALYFILIPAVALIILWYLGYSEYGKTTKRFLFTPLALNAVLSILSIQNGWFFSVNTANEYIRGPFFYVTTCVSYSYYILILIQLFRMRHTTISPSKFLVALVYFLPIIATILQFFYLKDSYITSSIATALLLYFLIVQEAKFDFDLPTKARNRIAFERMLSIAEQRNQELVLILFDMNNLKQVNDTWGHHEGDHLLLRLAELLQKTFSPDGKVFRIGGDEFCVILTRAKIGKRQSKMEQFELKLLKANTKLAHPIDVAWGYAESSNDEGISIRDAFTLADKAMYHHKAMIKESDLS